MGWKAWIGGLGFLVLLMAVLVVMARVFEWDREDLETYWDFVIILPLGIAAIIYLALQRRRR